MCKWYYSNIMSIYLKIRDYDYAVFNSKYHDLAVNYI